MKKIIGIFICLLVALSVGAQKKNASKKEPLFGKTHQVYQVTSNELRGACFYLVSGHGGPDPGAIGIYQGRQLHEDEYAYDIVLRLGRELMMRGAKVHFIVQDKKDCHDDHHRIDKVRSGVTSGDETAEFVSPPEYKIQDDTDSESQSQMPSGIRPVCNDSVDELGNAVYESYQSEDDTETCIGDSILIPKGRHGKGEILTHKIVHGVSYHCTYDNSPLPVPEGMLG